MASKFRLPCGWATRRLPGRRPELRGTWLDPARKPGPDAPESLRKSYRYWWNIHWATPPWITDAMWAQIKSLYDRATVFEEVDHVVPLAHPLVCGLHVPWNMQVISRRENQAKSNNWWPDCPDHLCPQKNLPADMFGDPEPHQLSIPL